MSCKVLSSRPERLLGVGAANIHQLGGLERAVSFLSGVWCGAGVFLHFQDDV